MKTNMGLLILSEGRIETMSFSMTVHDVTKLTIKVEVYPPTPMREFPFWSIRHRGYKGDAIYSEVATITHIEPTGLIATYGADTEVTLFEVPVTADMNPCSN